MMKKLALSTLLLLSSCTHFSVKEQAQSVFMLADELGGGTGFLVQAPSGKKYILTNAHVCVNRPPILSSERPAPPKIIEVSYFTDLCLMEAPQHLKEALIVAKEEPKPFDVVHIIGYGMLLGNTLSDGHYVGRLPGQVLSVSSPAYATNVILPGNSGSPVLNDQGRLVGVVFASGPVIANRTLMVSLDDLKLFLSIY